MTAYLDFQNNDSSPTLATQSVPLQESWGSCNILIRKESIEEV